MTLGDILPKIRSTMTSKPLNWKSLGLDASVKGVKVLTDHNDLVAVPVIPLNLVSDSITRSSPTITMSISDFFSVAASVALWTPTPGRRWRLRGGIISFGQAVAAIAMEVQISIGYTKPGVGIINLYNSFEWFPAAAIARPPIIFTIPGEGFLCEETDEPLNVTLGQNLVSPIMVFVWGNEE